jgi:4-amino-4-deoxy-L-arabinose transferase-like glycosyltransferase
MVIFTFIFIIAGLIVRNWQMAKVLFYDWDEGMYAQIAQEIIKNKSLFTTFNGQIWLDKPPLSHGLIALMLMIFGRSEFWMRTVMVILSLILLVLVYFLAKKIATIFSKSKNEKEITIAALLPVLTLAASPIFLERATMLNSDVLVAIGWLGYFLFWDKFWWKLFFLVIGVWSKSILGFYPLFFDFFNWSIHAFINHSTFKQLNLKRILRNSLLILIPSLWYIAGFIKYGQYFIDNHFLSQVFKRLYVPIELHFGGKFFYFSYLWDNLGVINILIIIAYILITINFSRYFNKEKFKLINSPKWLPALIYLSPLPFLLLLTIMKTKITWYVIIFLPLLSLTLSYLYLKLKPPLLKIGLNVIVLIYFVLNFPKQTYLLKINYQIPEKIKLAQCLSTKHGDKIAFLVDEDERKVKNFLEAAHYDTSSSFYYGGSPSFVYYSQKKVIYFYSIDEFIKNSGQYHLVVLSKKDASANKNLEALAERGQRICQSKDWLSIVK